MKTETAPGVWDVNTVTIMGRTVEVLTVWALTCTECSELNGLLCRGLKDKNVESRAEDGL